MPASWCDSGDTARLTADPWGWRPCGKRSPPGWSPSRSAASRG